MCVIKKNKCWRSIKLFFFSPLDCWIWLVIKHNIFVMYQALHEILPKNIAGVYWPQNQSMQSTASVALTAWQLRCTYNKQTTYNHVSDILQKFYRVHGIFNLSTIYYLAFHYLRQLRPIIHIYIKYNWSNWGKICSRILGKFFFTWYVKEHK